MGAGSKDLKIVLSCQLVIFKDFYVQFKMVLYYFNCCLADDISHGDYVSVHITGRMFVSQEDFFSQAGVHDVPLFSLFAFSPLVQSYFRCFYSGIYLSRQI